MNKTLFIVSTLGLLGAGCPSSTQWTGFYYLHATANPVSFEDIRYQPDRTSSVDAFASLEECEKWGLNVRASIAHSPGEPEDALLCAQKCTNGSWLRKGIVCDDKTGVIDVFGRK